MRVEPNWWSKQEYVKENPIFPINKKSIEFYNAYFELLKLQLEDNMTPFRKQIMMYVARAATMEMLNYLDKLADSLPANASRRQSVNHSDYIFYEPSCAKTGVTSA